MTEGGSGVEHIQTGAFQATHTHTVLINNNHFMQNVSEKVIVLIQHKNKSSVNIDVRKKNFL